VTSTGAAAAASVAGNPYAMTIAQGSLAAISGYAFAFNSPGTLTVNPAPVTVTALGGSSTVGSSPGNPGLSATGLQNGQSASALTGLSNSFGITGASSIGSYVMSVVGTLTNGNYTVVGSNSGTWNVAALRGPIGAGTPTFNGPSPSDPNMLVARPSGDGGDGAPSAFATSPATVDGGAAPGGKNAAAGPGGGNSPTGPSRLAATPGPSSPSANPPQSDIFAAPPAPAPVSAVPAESADASTALQSGCGGKAEGSGNAAADTGDCAAQAGCAPRDGVLVDVRVDRIDRGLVDEVRRREIRVALSEIDRPVDHRQPGHLADDGFAEDRGAAGDVVA
jgi:hypothetical protein